MDRYEIDFENKNSLDRSEWLRLLGVGEKQLAAAEHNDRMRQSIERMRQQMDEAEALLYSAARPRFCYRVLEEGELSIEGVSLSKHLEGCGQMIILAVTLGDAVDQLISETQDTRIALGVVADSGASVMADLAAELASEQIRKKTALMTAEGSPLFMTDRFSPGYGDSPLSIQKQLLGLLSAEETLGITLSETMMMRPSKSITGIHGLADHPVRGRLATCAECVLRDKCQLKKEGKRCYSTSHD